MREAVKMKKEAFWAWLAQESPEAANRYLEARRAVASTVAKAKIQVWEEMGWLWRRKAVYVILAQSLYIFSGCSTLCGMHGQDLKAHQG